MSFAFLFISARPQWASRRKDRESRQR